MEERSQHFEAKGELGLFGVQLRATTTGASYGTKVASSHGPSAGSCLREGCKAFLHDIKTTCLMLSLLVVRGNMGLQALYSP